MMVIDSMQKDDSTRVEESFDDAVRLVLHEYEGNENQEENSVFPKWYVLVYENVDSCACTRRAFYSTWECIWSSDECLERGASTLNTESDTRRKCRRISKEMYI